MKLVLQTYQGIVSLTGLNTGFVFLFMFLHHSTQFWKLVSQACMMKTDIMQKKRNNIMLDGQLSIKIHVQYFTCLVINCWGLDTCI